MTAFSPIMTSFNGGELSQRMHGRTDQGIYSVSAAEMENFVPTVEGPAMKRTGFRFIQAAAGSASWLSAFIFSVTQTYILEWGDLLVRFYTNGGRIDVAGSPYELAVPFTADQAPFVSHQQSYDRLYTAHPSHKPGAIRRDGATSFAYEDTVLQQGPFLDLNTDEAITVTVAGVRTVGGVLTVTANSAIFEAGHIGGSFLVEARSFSDVKAWEANVRVDSGSLAIGDLRRHGGRVYEAEAKVTGAVRTGADPPVHSRGSEWDGSGQPAAGTVDDFAGVKWKYRYDRYAIGTITAVAGDGLSATLTVTRAFADNLTTVASEFWRVPAICEATGYPRVVLLAFGRLIYFRDFHMHASVVGDYAGGKVNMCPYTEGGELAPDQAFTRRMAISNPVLWAKLDRGVILVGTADAIYAIEKVNPNDAFSTDNVQAVRQNHSGSDAVDPVQSATSTTYVQRGGRKLRELDYQLDKDRYPAPNINVWQRHITLSGVIQLAYQANPEELLWGVRNDGVLALHPHVPEQEIRGWARLTHGGGEIRSACVIPASGTADELWVLVERFDDDGNSIAKSIEVQAAPWEDGESLLEDAFFVDSGVSYSGVPITEFNTGLDHLVGLTVKILANGSVLEPQVVQAGSPKLSIPELTGDTLKLHVGLGYTARLKTLRPEVQVNGNTVQGKRKRLVSMIARLLETVGLKFDADGAHQDELVDRDAGMLLDDKPALFSGDTIKKSVSGNWEREGQGTFIHDDPTPCTIVAAMPALELAAS